MRLSYFDDFRAIAILFIVASHLFRPWNINTLPEMVVANLISGASTLFVFISGFFFHFVFYPKFQYNNFIIKKSKNVLLPYLLLSLIGFFLIVIYLDLPSPHFSNEVNSVYDLFILLPQYLWTGRILQAYWYVPFIMIVFLLSPIFIKYIKLSTKKQVFIFVLLIPTSMLIHRPGFNLSPIHSLIYYMPFYLLGIIVSINREPVMEFIKNKSIIFGLLTLIASVAQILIYGAFGHLHKEAAPLYNGINIEEILSYSGIDIILIQKIFMIFFILSILQKDKLKDLKLLKFVASASFAIYFIHSWVLFFLRHFSITEHIYFLPGPIVVLIEFLLVLGASLVIATFLKALLQKKSRYLIGW